MTKDEIIEMARQAGCVEDKHYKGEVIFISNDALERFAKLVAAKEREACAKVCETLLGPTSTDFYGNRYATAIRARGEQA